MVNTEKMRIYPQDIKFLNEICEVTGISHADIMNKIINSEVLKTREALKKFAEQNLEEKKKRLGL